MIQIQLTDSNNSHTTNILDKLHNITLTLQENLEQTQKSNEYNKDQFSQVLSKFVNDEEHNNSLEKKLEIHSNTIESELQNSIEAIEKKLEDSFKQMELTLKQNIESIDRKLEAHSKTIEAELVRVIEKIEKKLEGRSKPESLGLTLGSSIITENEIKTPEPSTQVSSESTTLEQSKTSTNDEVYNLMKFVFGSTSLEQSETTTSENETEDEDVLKIASESTTLEQIEKTNSANEIDDEDFFSELAKEFAEEVAPFKREPNPIQVGSKKYFIEHNTKVNWTSASENCRNMQAKLAILETEEELLEVRKHLDRVNYWIGLNDGEHEGTYVTEEGLPAEFLKWQWGEPSNGEGDENCIELKYLGGEHLMNDLGCATNVLYICEFDNE